MEQRKLKATLLSYYGSSRSIAERSWTSTNKADNRSDEEVSRVLKFMVCNGHTKPMETVVFSFRLDLDIASDRQIATYRMVTGSTAMSLRYCEATPIIYVPDEITGDARLLYMDSLQESLTKYEQVANQLVNDGFSHRRAREIARRLLPMGLHTRRELDLNLVSLAHVFKQRLDKHAEPEIRNLVLQMYAEVMAIPSLMEITQLLDKADWNI